LFIQLAIHYVITNALPYDFNRMAFGSIGAFRFPYANSGATSRPGFFFEFRTAITGLSCWKHPFAKDKFTHIPLWQVQLYLWVMLPHKPHEIGRIHGSNLHFCMMLTPGHFHKGK
jgi:hypothetical protein